MERKLTTIVAADVAGFSRLVGDDEERTLAMLRSHRAELIDPILRSHNGRIANTAGDSLLIEFPSSVEALRAMISIQEGMVERNSNIPERSRIVFRVGINVGDVVVEGADLLGDGVNIAARLENEAQPSGICISGTAFDQVKLALQNRCEFVGELELKNISEPVRAYRVLLADEGKVHTFKRTRNTSFRTRWLVPIVCLIFLTVGLSTWFSIQFHAGGSHQANQSNGKVAILPFKSLSSEQNFQFFADGLSQDLITDLSKIGDIPVVSSRSSFAYRETKLSHDDIAKKLNAQFIIDGSVRRFEQTLRISVSLIDVTSDSLIWAERYDGKNKDVFAFQDEITSNITRALKVVLSPEQQKAISLRGTENQDAYDSYLRGMRFLSSQKSLDVESNAAAVGAFQEALVHDPEYAHAYAGLAWADWIHYSTINLFTSSRKDSAFKNAEKSLTFADTALAHRVLSRKHFSTILGIYSNGKPELAARELRAALAIEPNNPDILAELADTLLYIADPPNALNHIKKAVSLNPDHPDWYLRPLGISQMIAGDYEKSVQSLRGWLKRGNTQTQYYVWLVAAEALAGNDEGAVAALAYAKKSDVSFPKNYAAVRNNWPLPEKTLEVLFHGLRKAGFSKD